ncbi:uncharacterized protein [Drosophila pseudoobscura]|uniref:RING-type domain-containing protein n=1 Tax=Drosophila pseudoobscura pseudoobscura TaxID=46245 RepID=A0A6I8VQA3_DROPS|nr:uncharacterized protein LOC117183494 [Drosophila pseudoobscura]XP_033233226.1 uncharacterized protein LOC117183494 [Drosophila pseudoobscura]
MEGEPVNPSVCILCGEEFGSLQLYKTRCGHEFHKACIVPYSKENAKCPRCGRVTFELQGGASVSGTQTAKQQAGSKEKASGTPATGSANNNPGSASVDGGNIGIMITQAVRAMQNDLLTQLSEQMAQIIQTNVAAHLQLTGRDQHARNIAPDHSSQGQEAGGGRESAGFYREGRDTPRSLASDLSQRPDKVVHIMNGWKLRFSGDAEGISVDNFIYRVEALTHATLESNFAVLCSNASILFDGKAREFFWRFHKSVVVVRWDVLCQALKKQFRDTRTDVDIREAIRDRKQKEKEGFDAFYDAIVQLMDSLESPLSEKSVVDILRRNLRPEVRHELLNIKITSVGELREICRRRESFLEDVRRNYGYQKSVPFRRQVAELVEEHMSDDATEFSEGEGEAEIGALALVCWNCHKEGHRYQDCESKRKIFCYGCGIPNIYKPACEKCQKKNGRASTQPRQLQSVRRQKSANPDASQ